MPSTLISALCWAHKWTVTLHCARPPRPPKPSTVTHAANIAPGEGCPAPSTPGRTGTGSPSCPPLLAPSNQRAGRTLSPAAPALARRPQLSPWQGFGSGSAARALCGGAWPREPQPPAQSLSSEASPCPGGAATAATVTPRPARSVFRVSAERRRTAGLTPGQGHVVTVQPLAQLVRAKWEIDDGCFSLSLPLPCYSLKNQWKQSPWVRINSSS